MKSRFSLVHDWSIRFRAAWTPDSWSSTVKNCQGPLFQKLDFHWSAGDQWKWNLQTRFLTEWYADSSSWYRKTCRNAFFCNLNFDVLLTPTNKNTHTRTNFVFARPSFQSRELAIYCRLQEVLGGFSRTTDCFRMDVTHEPCMPSNIPLKAF